MVKSTLEENKSSMKGLIGMASDMVEVNISMTMTECYTMENGRKVFAGVKVLFISYQETLNTQVNGKQTKNMGKGSTMNTVIKKKESGQTERKKDNSLGNIIMNQKKKSTIKKELKTIRNARYFDELLM